MNKMTLIHVARLRTAAKWGGGLVGLTLFILWSGGFFHKKIAPGAADVPPGAPLPAGAELFVAKIEELPARIEVVGSAAPAGRIQLGARIAASVTEVLAAAGDAVARGQVLVRLDDRELREQLAAAEAEFAHASAEFGRARALFDREAGTEQALSAAESAYQAARARLERARVLLSYAEVAAPVAGRVIERRVEAGDFASPGQVLLTLYDPSRMRIEAPVPVRLLDYVAIGGEVAVRFDQPELELRGVVEEIVGEVDPRSRTQMVKIALAGGDERILPGSFGRLLLEGSPQPTLRIPATAVYTSGQLELVHVAHEGRVLRRTVKTGLAAEDWIEILSGLSGGEQVLVKPVLEN